MVNIQIQCCAFVILMIFNHFFARTKRLNLKTQQAFMYLLVVSNACVIFDIVSVFAIVYSDNLPIILVDFICKLYLVSLAMLCFSGWLYICADLHVSDKRFGLNMIPMISVLGLGTFFIAVLPIQIHCENGGAIVYSEGPSTIVAYICAAILFMLIIYKTIAERKRLHLRRRKAVMYWVSAWMLGALIQFMNSKLLVVSFCGIIGVVIIYLMLENPENNLDRETGFFNQTALFQYLKECYTNHKEFSAVIVIARTIPLKNEMLTKKEYIFRSGSDEITIVYNQVMNEENTQHLKEYMNQIDNHQEYKMICIPNSNIVPNIEDLMDMLHLIRGNEERYLKENVMYINQAFVQEIEQRKRMEKLIQSAMEEDRIEVFYQPIYSVEHKMFCSAEALVRIRDAEGKIVMPGAFIPVAEETRQIVPLGKTVLDKVCKFLSYYEEQELGLKYVEVNLSVVQAENSQLTKDVMQVIDYHGVSAGMLNLEITESASLQGRQNLLQSMGELIHEGLEFSLDDFGTGQSNLNYIAEMPVAIVKFDRQMVQGYFESERTKHILTAAIRMIHDMGLKVVAEGVETKEQLDEMVNLGIEFIQGYYFSKPIPENQFVAFLKENNKVA